MTDTQFMLFGYRHEDIIHGMYVINSQTYHLYKALGLPYLPYRFDGADRCFSFTEGDPERSQIATCKTSTNWNLVVSDPALYGDKWDSRSSVSR